jgi:RNA polymerase sigma-70 factor (ECF subfamily)
VQTDEQLVAASLQGLDGAFDELVVRYRTPLLRFLLSRSASRADAEDAIQDTFVNAYRYLYSFNSRWRFSTWLYRIALRNLARQAEVRRPETEIPADVADRGGDPLQECVAASERSNVRLTARQVLTGDAYAAMWLRYVEDMAVKDVARTLDKSTSWAKVTLMRARRRLESELSAGESDAAAGMPVTPGKNPAKRSENYG